MPQVRGSTSPYTLWQHYWRNCNVLDREVTATNLGHQPRGGVRGSTLALHCRHALYEWSSGTPTILTSWRQLSISNSCSTLPMSSISTIVAPSLGGHGQEYLHVKFLHNKRYLWEGDWVFNVNSPRPKYVSQGAGLSLR